MYGCRSFTSIDLSNNLAYSDTQVFSRCKLLTYIKISKSVISIAHGVFFNCSAHLKIEANICNVKNIHYSKKKKRLISIFGSPQHIEIPNEIAKICVTVFYYCQTPKSVKSVFIPGSVNRICLGGFMQSLLLFTVNIPESITSIGAQAFYNYISLTSINKPSKIVEISQKIFAYCTSLAFVEISNSAKIIGEYAFENCISLTSVIIHDNVTSVQLDSFGGCSFLISVTKPNRIDIDEKVFYRYPIFTAYSKSKKEKENNRSLKS